ncbi:MAG: hypothetical protein OEM67_09185 [Thermoleophilia bacterium]|nr:hypothetical protein [Thermoleophilia bacterium]
MDERDLADLPSPVAQYLRSVGVLGRPIPEQVGIVQQGRIRLSPSGRWRRITAEQTFFSDPPGFIWSARASVVPLVRLAVTDRYRDGTGSLEVRAFGAIPISTGSGPDLDTGGPLRLLSELLWKPEAFLAPYVSWAPIDSRTTRATISDRGLEEHAQFRFGNHGPLCRITAVRHKDAGTKSSALRRWVATGSDYRSGAGGFWCRAGPRPCGSWIPAHSGTWRPTSRRSPSRVARSPSAHRSPAGDRR